MRFGLHGLPNSGSPKCIQVGEGGEWGNEVRADLCSERRIKLPFRGTGAHPWILERRGGIARGIKNRLVAGGRFSGNQISAEV